MVSLPVLKNLMLQASRLVKGAAVADRIVLCGVPCFILSKDPAPELAAVLARKESVSQLSTIAETEIHLEDEATSTRKFARGQYRQRDVILHLTGGGFFAHTIASDLPYLLDWSSSTGSVVICPEVRNCLLSFLASCIVVCSNQTHHSRLFDFVVFVVA